MEMYEASAAYLRERIIEAGLGDPALAVILGSGLGAYAASDAVADRVVIPYREIPNFPTSTVSYQKGELVIGRVGEKTVLFFNGRFHYYEGWEMWQTAYPVNVCHLLGISKMIITNAAGGINTETLEPGDLVLLTDHIKLCADSPVRGKNEAAFGERFFDMQAVYDKDMRALTHACAKEQGNTLKEGVYAYMAGPQFETPAEIRMFRMMGADAVGMSTVPEAIVAAHCGLDVVGISCITNMAAGVLPQKLNHREVVETAALVHDKFQKLLTLVIDLMDR
jgi:purine-nucleoside phosphorylase